jgi:Domain of unknown function (DUF397)
MSHELTWKKSSYSGSEGNCVEVAKLPGGGRAVRDSKNTAGPALRFGSGPWREFVAMLKQPLSRLANCKCVAPVPGPHFSCFACTANGR